MQYLPTDGIDKTAGDAATPILGKFGEVLADRRDMLMRFGALAIGVLAFTAAAQATVADDDDGAVAITTMVAITTTMEAVATTTTSGAVATTTMIGAVATTTTSR